MACRKAANQQLQQSRIHTMRKKKKKKPYKVCTDGTNGHNHFKVVIQEDISIGNNIDISYTILKTIAIACFSTKLTVIFQRKPQEKQKKKKN